MDPDRQLPEAPFQGDTGRPGARAGRATRILIIDGEAIVRFGLVRFLESHGWEVCGEAGDVGTALLLSLESNPTVIIMDPLLQGDGSALRLIGTVREKLKDVAILVFSTMEETVFAEPALRAGASGFLMKSASQEEIVEAVEAVERGEIHVSERVRSEVLRKAARGSARKAAHPLGILTDRELEVFQLLGDGLGTREVGDQLGISSKTVETHRAKIMRKLGLENAAQLLHRAIAWSQFGVEDPPDPEG